ncbi:hypothetical protein H6G45_14160 [Synechocystis sp. FACHB-383]|uniref:hypothetical protein n=1 Tax=Synechocystis sp. FACHB-383 TaxID=2692864 RepID=UPI001681D1A3|nr:hypothetical protein [Synechocystis sp. FACHB-383]MBD2654604.1 hypothetical protein [Synechocystis sp. FACHB-383]
MIEDYLTVAYYLSGIAECYFTSMYGVEDMPKRALVLKLEDDPYNIRCIEFKTPEEEGDECSCYVNLNGRVIIPSVVRYKDHPIKRLRQLHKATNIPYVKMIYNLMEIAECAKGMELPSDTFNHVSTIVTLELARYVNRGKDIKFLDNPPAL